MERTRGVADVSSMHMVLNNQISLKDFYASSDTSPIPSYPCLRHLLHQECNYQRNWMLLWSLPSSTYANSSVIVVSVYLPAYAHLLYSQVQHAYAHILYSQVQHASGIDISQGNGLGWNLDTLMHYIILSHAGRSAQ